jgi:transcriptional regulator with XRE-family HTH domain|nr:helix-turn-helix transcriptional regulator [Treponema sp.]
MDETTKIRTIMAYNIRKLRESKSLTQQELANRCGITPLAVCKIEGGKVWPKDSSVESIAAALGVESQDLFVNKRIEDTLNEKIQILQKTLSELQCLTSALNKPV